MSVFIKICQPDGTKIPDNSETALINLGLTSIFNDVKLLVNHVQVNPQSSNYNYKVAIETILNYSPAVKNTRLQLAGYYEVGRKFFQKRQKVH